MGKNEALKIVNTASLLLTVEFPIQYILTDVGPPFQFFHGDWGDLYDNLTKIQLAIVADQR